MVHFHHFRTKGLLIKYQNIDMSKCRHANCFYQNLDKFRITLNYVGCFLTFDQTSDKIYRLAHILVCQHFESEPIELMLSCVCVSFYVKMVATSQPRGYHIERP